MSGIKLFNQAIKENLIDNKKYLKGRMHYLPDYMNMSVQLIRQQKKRNKHLEKHLTVPPIMIISVTNACNLKCTGCYANAQDRDFNREMSIENIDRIIKEGIDLGVGIIMIAGGEPLMKEGLLSIIKKYKQTIFIMFTNGLLITDGLMNDMKSMKHLVPVFSLEGNENTTDHRRGEGIYQAVMDKMSLLDQNKMLFGTSITLTKENYEEVMNDDFVRMLESKGARTLFLIEYVPCHGERSLCLTEDQKADLLLKIKHYQDNFSILPIPLPGDESHFEGCLAAGRGFIHISSAGDIEACPFAPYSDVNIKNMSLEEGLQSRLLTQIRLNHHLLEESEGGCTLFENPEWVGELMVERKSCSSII